MGGCDVWQLVIAAYANGRWVPGIGDPTVYGWLTVGGYLAAAVLAWRARRRTPDRPERAFWIFLIVAFGLLAINKQLDLQSWFTQLGRAVVRDAGWSARRRELQRWFVYGVASGAGLILLAVGVMIRRRPLAYWLAFAGLVFTAAFVVIRAASFHHVDHMLGRRYAWLPLNFILEFGGITLTAVGTLMHLQRRRSSCLEHSQ